MSEAEKAWESRGYLTMFVDPYFPDGLRVESMQYEPFSINLPGGSYTPDFLVVLDNGMMVLVEVKMSKKARGYRDTRSKLRAAAAMYPWFIWIEARWSGRREDSWTIEHIDPKDAGKYVG